MKTNSQFTVMLLCGICCLLNCRSLQAAEPRSTAGLTAARKQAAQRQRRLIYDNDGNEALTKMRTTDPQSLLDLRTTGLEGSHVDTIFYGCNAGFGTCSRGSNVWKVHDVKAEPHIYNQTAELLKAGIDPLAVIVSFGKQHGIEVFLGVRMNDTHDAAPTGYGRVRFTNTPLKMEHPEFLLGSLEHPPKHGRWSAIDYSHDQVRNSLFQYVEEGMLNYDIDGIHLDFFRHPVFFPSTAQGNRATLAELAQMTELMQRIRRRADEIALQRGRPMLISIRVPDSKEYCRAIGLDLENWLKQDLTDLLVVAGYFQLNDWTTSVKLGHQYGVRVYPSLDESRIRDEAARTARMDVPGYRGRAAAAWDSGADGVCLFNLFNPRSALWRELGDPAQLHQSDRDYFGSDRGFASAAGGNFPHADYFQAESINPQRAKNLVPGKSVTSKLALGEQFQLRSTDSARLRLRFDAPLDSKQAIVRFNGRTLQGMTAKGEWLECDLSHETLKSGTNTVSVQFTGRESRPIAWQDVILEVRVP